MDYKVNRFVIDVSGDCDKASTDQLDIDFFLQPERRKVILGTVRFPDGKPAPCSVVKFFKQKHSTTNTDNYASLESIGHAITDDNGQFLLGPVYPGEKIIIKIFYLGSPIVRSAENPITSTLAPDDY